MEAVATVRDGSPGIDVFLGIPYASLIFLKQGDVHIARYEAIVQILDERGRKIIAEYPWGDTVRTGNYGLTQRFESLIVEKRFTVEPGEYVVQTVLQDANSQKEAERRLRLTVFGPSRTEPMLSRIRMEARVEDDPFEPVVAYHLPSRLDSLRAIVEVYNAPVGEDVLVEMILTRFRSDTSVAPPPYWLTPPVGSLAYRGIDYSRSDTIQVSRRTLRELEEDVTVEFSIPALEFGNYRTFIQASMASTSAADTTAEGLPGRILLKRQRDLSVKSLDFPHVTTLDQLIASLAYIAQDREIREIRDAATVPEARIRFDRFWGSLVNNRQAALNLMKQYYGRVEEANLFFTAHKEGWKTDRGMIYMVLGPPMYVENLFDGEVWHYSYSDRDAINTFKFKRVRSLDIEAGYDNYVLIRRPYYERMWTMAIERWRSGNAM
jgi:GWxTD domain-containing protein